MLVVLPPSCCCCALNEGVGVALGDPEDWEALKPPGEAGTVVPPELLLLLAAAEPEAAPLLLPAVAFPTAADAESPPLGGEGSG